MKTMILFFLLSSTQIFASDECISDQNLDQQATKTLELATVELGDNKECLKLKKQLKANLCDSVEQNTICFAQEVVEYLCDWPNPTTLK